MISSCVSNGNKPKILNSKPNIIFIMADDLGYGDLGCYGQQQILTPNIDQLAEEGVKFTNVYAGSTVCAPSRSVLMTGLHTGHTTVRGNTSMLARTPENPSGRVSLKSTDVTVAEVLKKAGYITGITGKWGLAEPGDPGVPNKKGFDQWLGFLNQNRAHNYYPDYIWKNETKYRIAENKDGKKEIYVHDLFTMFSLDFIQANKDTSFFLYLPYTIPHDEYEIPNTEPYTGRPWSKEEIIYAAMITRMDRDIGKIMKLLADLKIDKNTIVFFCSDNGAAHRWEDGFNSSGTLRGRKRDLYEGGIRVPMIVRYPGKITPNRVDSTSIWYFADVLPTFTDIAGVTTPEGLDGENVWPAIVSGKPLSDDRILYWEFYEKEFSQAARWKNWKAVRVKGQKDWELYDLSNDPEETTNLASLHPDIINIIAEWTKNNRTESPYWSSGLQ